MREGVTGEDLQLDEVTLDDVRHLVGAVGPAERYRLLVSREVATSVTREVLERLESEFGRPIELVVVGRGR